MVQVSEGYEFLLEGGILGRSSVTIAVQHAGNPEQSCGVMFFNRNEILLSLDEDGVTDMIIGVLKRWKGKHPDRFQDIKSML